MRSCSCSSPAWATGARRSGTRSRVTCERREDPSRPAPDPLGPAMCGIAGVVSADPAVRARLSRMLEVVAHRGPDDLGMDTIDECAIGQRRLSIIDLAGGHQPMFDETGDLAITFNGEIYSY